HDARWPLQPARSSGVALRAVPCREERSSVTVQVRIPPVLRTHTGGERIVAANGDTVTDVLHALGSAYPGLGSAIFEEGGSLRPFLNVYVNDEDIRFLSSGSTPVAEGDTIALLPALAGGADEAGDATDSAAADADPAAGHAGVERLKRAS